MDSSVSIRYFTVGAALLVVPLIVIITLGSPACTQGPSVPSYCVSSSTFKFLSSFLPFVMVVGGVLIGYRMKKISDSLKPEDDEDEEREDDNSSMYGP